MPKSETKTFGACLKLARMEAGYATREIADGPVPISASVQGRHERDEKRPCVEDAMEYANAYGAPDLLMHYCRLCCPIGNQSMGEARQKSLSLIDTNLRNRLRRISSMADRLSEIADDDRIDGSERKDFDAIVQELAGFRDLIDEFMLLSISEQKKIAPRCERRSDQPRPFVKVCTKNYTAFGATGQPL